MKYRKQGKIRQLSENRILILCEGKTEKVYLEGLVRSFPKKLQYNFDFKIIAANHGEPVSALKELKNKLKKAKREMQPYTDSWLIFDDDKRDLSIFFQILIKDKINYVYSSISIEFWFLLHLRNTSTVFNNADAVIRELKKELGSYSKTDSELWNKLKPNYEKAKTNAQFLRNKHQEEGIGLHLYKPYSNMDELVDRIKSFNQ